MGDWPLLSLVTFLPLVGVVLIAVLRGDPEVVAKNSRSIALWTSLLTFLLSLAVWNNFDPTQAGFQLVEKSPWLVGLGVSYYLGVDGISLWFVLLGPADRGRGDRLLALGHARVKEYMIAFLVMDTLMIGVFVSLDAVLFYLFFEAILIPMYLIIGIWGGRAGSTPRSSSSSTRSWARSVPDRHPGDLPAHRDHRDSGDDGPACRQWHRP